MQYYTNSHCWSSNRPAFTLCSHLMSSIWWLLTSHCTRFWITFILTFPVCTLMLPTLIYTTTDEGFLERLRISNFLRNRIDPAYTYVRKVIEKKKRRVLFSFLSLRSRVRWKSHARFWMSEKNKEFSFRLLTLLLYSVFLFITSNTSKGCFNSTTRIFDISPPILTSRDFRKICYYNNITLKLNMDFVHSCDLWLAFSSPNLIIYSKNDRKCH